MQLMEPPGLSAGVITRIIGPPEAVGSDKSLLVELNGEPFYGLDSRPALETAAIDCGD